MSEEKLLRPATVEVLESTVCTGGEADATMVINVKVTWVMGIESITDVEAIVNGMSVTLNAVGAPSPVDPSQTGTGKLYYQFYTGSIGGLTCGATYSVRVEASVAYKEKSTPIDVKCGDCIPVPLK